MLLRSLYGTRDAAMNWQAEVTKAMRSWVFQQGKYNPCLYIDKAKGIEVLVHGDDFVSVGTADALRNLHKRMQERFEIKTTFVGRRTDM